MLPDFLHEDVDTVARKLLGCLIISEIGNRRVVGRIVETESYDETDMASHTYNGKTPRNATMFGAPGHMYVYFTYGMHYCCNVVAGREGQGAGVLVRAVEPVEGIGIMEIRRRKKGVIITNGPAKVCQALGIDITYNGHDLKRKPIMLQEGETDAGEAVVVTTRIGITKDTDRLRRFYLKDNPYVSKP